MHKIICVGSATKDIFFPTDEGKILETPADLLAQRKISFELGAKYHIEKRHETLGGCAVNVACGLARQGESVICHVGIGNDETGKWIKTEIDKEKVEIEAVEILNGCESDLSAIVVEKNSGERVIFSNHGASQLFKVKKEFLNDASWFFVCDLSGTWQKNLQTVFLEAKKQNSKVVFNPRQQMLHQDIGTLLSFLPYCETLLVNKDEAIEIAKAIDGKYTAKILNDEIFLLKTLHNLGIEKIVITDGEKGAWAYDGNEMFFAEAILQKTLDTTGAGDAFASGFLGAQLKGGRLLESLKWGIINSSNSVRYYGGIEGLLSAEEILSKVDEVQIKKIVW